MSEGEYPGGDILPPTQACSIRTDVTSVHWSSSSNSDDSSSSSSSRAISQLARKPLTPTIL